jgi:hypothetical protein
LHSLNLLFATINHYHLSDSGCFIDALKMKAKLEGKYSKTKFRFAGFLWKAAKPIDMFYKSCILVISYTLAFIFASVRFVIFYIPNLIRLFLK